MKKLIQSLFILLLIASTAIAQERTVTGTVTSAEDGFPLPGVSVKVKGAATATQTNANGQYSIAVPGANSILVFSFIGTVTKELAVPASGVLSVSLDADTKQLSEVVVTALGISREAKSLGYSTATLKSDALTEARETNVLNSIAGKAAGVRINSQSGTLGGSSKIVIRGVNSLGANETLFVIDGVPVSNSTSTGGTTLNNVDYGNRMGDLSPDDIESITILKGAAAAALYGTRAKDGAVIITSKKGNMNSKTSVTINSSLRFENPLVLPDFQNEYTNGNYGVYNLKNINGWGPQITGQTVQDFTGDQVALQAYPDNVKDFFDTGVSYINNIAFAGGDSNSDYRFSFSSANEKGIIPQSSLDKYSFALNAGRQFSKKLSSRFTGSYTRIGAEGRPSQSSNNTNIITSAIFGLPRTIDIKKLRDNVIDEAGNQIFLSTNKDGNNPYWILDYNTNNNKVDRFIGSYLLTFKPVEWITISNNIGGDIYGEKRSSVTRKGTAGTIKGKFNNVDLFYRQINDDFLVTIDQDNLVKDFKFKLILGGNINDRESSSTTVDAVDLTIDQLYNYPNAASSTPLLAYSRRRLLGAFGDLNISYKDFLYFDITGRNDWFSTLPINSRSYFYPSVSSGFVFSELLRNKNMDWLSYGKLRGSWATVGSDLEAYNLDFQYTPISTVFLQYVGSATTVFPAGPISTAFAGPRTLPNSTLVPQRQKSYEFGAELKFLQSRIGLDFTYYNTVTRKQLIPVDVAISTGYFAKYVNVGAIRNSGVELALNLVPVKTKNFGWNVDVTFAKNNQKVEELAENLTQYSLASGWSGLQIKANVGESFGLYGTKFERDPASGEYVINPANGLRNVVTNQRLGNIYADWTMGVNNTFNYKMFTLSALLDIRQGGVFYSGTVANLRTSGLAAETGGDRTPIVDKGVVLDGGVYVPNTKAVSSMQDFWNLNYAVSNTEANVFDASFIKLREIRLFCAIPSSVISKSKFIKSAEIGVEGRNLWLIKSHVPHVDPELNFFGAGSAGEGVEFNSVPSTRSFGMNLRLTF